MGSGIKGFVLADNYDDNKNDYDDNDVDNYDDNHDDDDHDDIDTYKK